MTEARLLAHSGHGRAAVCAHARLLRGSGSAVVYVTVMNTADRLRPQLGDGPEMFFVDVTGFGPSGVAFGPDVFYVDSPVKLEKMAMVVRRLCRRLKHAHVVVDCIDGMADYNGDDATLETAHYLVNQAKQDGASIDLVVGAKHRLLERLRPIARTLIKIDEAEVAR